MTDNAPVDVEMGEAEILDRSNEKIQDEYEIQHFGFSASEFVTCVCQNVDGHTTKVLAEFEKQYISQNGESPDLTECMKNLREAYKSSIETYKQNVTSYSKKYFTIPPNVLLPGNEDQRIQLTDLEHQKLDEDIKVLEQKIQNEYFVQFDLEKKHQLYNKLLEEAVNKLETIERESDLITAELNKIDLEELNHLLIEIERYLDPSKEINS